MLSSNEDNFLKLGKMIQYRSFILLPGAITSLLLGLIFLFEAWIPPIFISTLAIIQIFCSICEIAYTIWLIIISIRQTRIMHDSDLAKFNIFLIAGIPLRVIGLGYPFLHYVLGNYLSPFTSFPYPGFEHIYYSFGNLGQIISQLLYVLSYLMIIIAWKAFSRFIINSNLGKGVIFSGKTVQTGYFFYAFASFANLIEVLIITTYVFFLLDYSLFYVISSTITFFLGILLIVVSPIVLIMGHFSLGKRIQQRIDELHISKQDIS